LTIFFYKTDLNQRVHVHESVFRLVFRHTLRVEGERILCAIG